MTTTEPATHAQPAARFSRPRFDRHHRRLGRSHQAWLQGHGRADQGRLRGQNLPHQSAGGSGSWRQGLSVSGRHSGHRRSGADLHAGFLGSGFAGRMRQEGGQGGGDPGQRLSRDGPPGRYTAGAGNAGCRTPERRTGHWPEHLGDVQPAQEAEPAGAEQCQGGRYRPHLAIGQHAVVAGAGSRAQRSRRLQHLRRAG
jgi:hypothetical protein